MTSLILAAGYATRLYPLTENFPKPLLEVGGKSVLDWVMEDIDAIDQIERHVVVSNSRYLPHFQEWKEQSSYSKEIILLDDGSTENENRLGAVKDILFAIEEVGLDEDLLVLAADNLLDFSFKGFVDYFGQKQATCIMRHHEPSVEKLTRTGVITIDISERVLMMEEKPTEPKSHWAVPPFYVYKREDILLLKQAIEEGCNTDAPGSFIAWLSQKRPVYAYLMEGKRWDIGNLESYERVKEEFTGPLR
jgi:glucose-1-phosphate thymidylyltransferase